MELTTRRGRIAETFYSIQGEGATAGLPAIFVRLQGCSVGCGWCDTKYSWDPAAAAWCEYLAAHARRLYGAVTDAARVAAALLATRLSEGRLASPFSAREV